jgi:endonuclease/exonuclease/phosphatase (EEP) superfamily protein YafD
MRALSNWPIWIGVVPIAGFAAIRTTGLDRGFPCLAAMAFTPYVATVAPLLAAVGLAFQNWAAAIVSALATISFAATILPRTFGRATVSAVGGETLRVLAANAHEGSASPRGIIDLVARLKPDILTIEELTPQLNSELEAAGLGSHLPFGVIDAGRYSSGTGIYSRFPLRRLAAADSVPRMARAEATVSAGRGIRIVAVHPYPPDHRTQTRVWEELLAALPTAGRGSAWILAGDFNATLDMSPFRKLLGRGYQDAGEAAGKGLQATFPQGGLLPPPITIDHILADRRLGIVSYSVEPLANSDHRAIFAELALPEI